MAIQTELQTKLKELRLSLGYKNQTSFAEELGVTQGTIANMECGKREVSRPLLIKIKEKFNIDLISWNENHKQESLQDDNIVAIPFYHIGASAGEGTYLMDEPCMDMLYFDKRLLQQVIHTDNFSSLQFLYASGDSMDSGWNQPDDIKNGDLLLIDTSITSGNNQVFVILVNNSELRVKRLFKRGEALYISSNNPKYKEEVYYPDNTDFEIKVMGKVIWNFKSLF